MVLLLRYTADRVRRRGAVDAVALLAAVAGATALLAGCGGAGANHAIANVARRSTATGRRSSIPAIDAGGGAVAGAFTAGDSSSQEVSLAGTLRFSRCMRANGVESFPDPNSQGAIQFNSSEIDPNSPQFDRAQQRCARYMGGATAPSPAQRAQALARALALAKCMRAQGVSGFPDPPAGGAPTKIAGSGAAPPGLDPNSPIFRRAIKACTSPPAGGVGNVPIHTGARVPARRS